MAVLVRICVASGLDLQIFVENKTERVVSIRVLVVAKLVELCLLYMRRLMIFLRQQAVAIIEFRCVQRCYCSKCNKLVHRASPAGTDTSFRNNIQCRGGDRSGRDHTTARGGHRPHRTPTTLFVHNVRVAYSEFTSFYLSNTFPVPSMIPRIDQTLLLPVIYLLGLPLLLCRRHLDFLVDEKRGVSPGAGQRLHEHGLPVVDVGTVAGEGYEHRPQFCVLRSLADRG
mmetsp:Transcript_14306/g.35612  ORF Transcript_14306/g.35612 Transcript_14306/m.35612 type:complete len:227 (+) Transcript_14306:163-843(+)